MIGNILPLMKLCSFILVISALNGIYYLLLKKRLILMCQKDSEEVHKAIGCEKVKMISFIREPSETGNNTLDLLLFKTHRSVMWCISFLMFYPVSVIGVYLLLHLYRGHMP
jgi:uncharacterized membrane protein